jgi:arginine decarboxylase
MVWHANVAPDDIVVVDRNCHVSILHAITMTGAIPVFLTPTRNHLGIIGPIPLEEFSPESIAAKIEANPFARAAKRKKPRILTITQSTYDGVLYNVEMLKDTLNSSIDTLHFDEAWLPHATFHDFYKNMHAIGRDRPRTKDAMIYATHSTHKLLAGISQASQILVQESQTRKLDRHSFNEAYLMHTSTSPQYAIIASCDVAAAMMEPPGGTALVEESILEALDFRRAMKKIDNDGARTGGSRCGARKRSPPTASARARNGFSRPTRSGTASATSRRASTCSIRSRPRSSRRGWTSRASSPSRASPRRS